MKLHELPRTNQVSQKRLGRGHGSGRGKTAGRGTKGQKARGKIPAHFEGGQLSITRRLPLLRGKGRNRSRKTGMYSLDISDLTGFTKPTEITTEVLHKQGLVPGDAKRVKIIGTHALTVALHVSVPCSTGARMSIEKAGGSVKPE